MLKRVLTCQEPVRLVLLSDPTVWEAQVRKARTIVDRDIDEAPKGDFVDSLIAAVRATSGDSAAVVQTLHAVKAAGRQVLKGVLAGDDEAEAQGRLDEALAEEDVRQALAFVRAQTVAAAYRESSNIEDLLDSCPEGATHVMLMPMSRDDIRRVERSVGPRPRLGALHHSHAGDRARRAGRQGKDSVEAFTEYLAELTEEQQQAVESFEDWVAKVDRAVFAASVQSVEGFDLEPVGGKYPVDEFEAQCGDASEVVTEVSRHARQVISLGKSASLSSRCTHGTRGLDNAATLSATGGPVPSALATTDGQPSPV
jgi:hypothetical protein